MSAASVSATVAATVAAGLAIQELDRMKAMQCIPEPQALLQRLEARTADFHLLAEVCAFYLQAQGVSE